jgi:hypothetical protein
MFSTELQYTVVRYMLNDLADEAANVGLVAATIEPFRVMHRFLDDPAVKSRSDARVNREAIDWFSSRVEASLPRLSEDLKGEHQAEGLFHQLSEMASGVVRTTAPRSVLTNDANAEFDLLFNQWVAPQTPRTVRNAYAPRDPLGRLRREAAAALVREFKQGYGKPLSRKVFSRSYAIRGASSHYSTFDLVLHSRTKRKLHERLFHHLLVLPDAEDSYTQAAGLAWRWQDVTERNGADRELTAVLYERSDQRSRGIADAMKLLKKEDIAVIDLKELREVAKQVDPQLSMA